MLYTVVPLDRIYANPRSKEIQKYEEKCKQKGEAQAEYREVQLPNGRVITRREGENYVVERINSTDMCDYLNENYSPGKSIK